MGRSRPGLPGRWRLLALAAAVAVAATATAGLVRSRTVQPSPGTPASAPAWRSGVAPCLPDPLAGVAYPTRFVVVANCSTVSGTVRRVGRDPADGELNMLVELDRRYARFLTSRNGRLRATAVPRDLPALPVLKAGQHATFYGAWVLDRNQDHQPAMHPVWAVALTPRPGVAPPSTPDARPDRADGQRLVARIRAPRSVPVGGAMDVLVHVDAVHQGARRPLPEANLFLEVTNEDGRGVQWKAATTNSLGSARLALVALEHPGSFTIRLYVDKLRRSTVVSAPFTVRRR